ncbi:MAG: XRE family transcriptional regulator [Planctomycetota bacterium]|nr:MAG: XRE family transcriptional regulator [Planctomycetota bacterium]
MGTSPQHNPSYRRLRAQLKAMRSEAELTQRALAARLKKPHSFVAKVEHGDRRIDPVEFVRWCKACRVDPSEAIRRVK